MATLSRLARGALLGLFILPSLWAGATLAAEAYSEDAVKAAFLYRFADFVDWPTSQGARFTISVLDDEPIAGQLQLLLSGHRVKDKPAEVRPIHTLQQLAGPQEPQILYIGRAYRGSVHSLLDAIGARPILVVADEDNGLNDGAIINFLFVDRRVRFEVSLVAAQRARLHVSSELLAVAAHVEGARP